ncbi:hypothetical protein [Actinomadura macrotermitis]|uniref:Uncharacterized protein n=1 Tax=Actinomadura macrotermitis TaxID=2585200 RepID=A0A7K0C3E8_9ACTN|nr:hypothetical protein [Actinomadura macrotermitis]
MNPLDNPAIIYLRAMLGVRLDRARDEDLSRGASAIEWAIITAVLATIALGIGIIITQKIMDKAHSIDVNGKNG